MIHKQQSMTETDGGDKITQPKYTVPKRNSLKYDELCRLKAKGWKKRHTNISQMHTGAMFISKRIHYEILQVKEKMLLHDKGANQPRSLMILNIMCWMTEPQTLHIVQAMRRDEYRGYSTDKPRKHTKWRDCTQKLKGCMLLHCISGNVWTAQSS